MTDQESLGWVGDDEIQTKAPEVTSVLVVDNADVRGKNADLGTVIHHGLLAWLSVVESTDVKMRRRPAELC